MPGAPSSSWRLFIARLRAKFSGANPGVCAAFWLFGLINNIFYVIILSAALDLVGPTIGAATVLLACIVPGLATKIVVPYFIHLISYSVRILSLVALSTSGMLAVALSPPTTEAQSVTAKVVGIILANVSSGAGEVNFLALTHFYGPFSLASWGSGTGGAGLLGAGAYALATTTFGFSVRTTLMSSATLPMVMLLSFFAILPRGPLKTAERKSQEYRALPTDEEPSSPRVEATRLLSQPPDRSTVPISVVARLFGDFKDKIARARTLVVPYMLPLFLVYLAEYAINQGVAPTLLFQLSETPFSHFRAFYPVYSALYQTGVFISRSSLPLVRIRNLYTPSLLQVVNFVVLTTHAAWPFIPSVWIVFAIVFWEGLLGGLVYVSTFAAVREEVEEEEREFSLGAVTVSDSAGIFLAGLLGVGLARVLCDWQVAHGQDWCRKV